MEKNVFWQPEGQVCAFSGYRPSKLPFSSEQDPACLSLKMRLKDEIYTAVDQGCTDFLCGMALGTDTWAAELVLEVKETLDGIKPVHLHAYLPFAGQDARWSAKSRKRYHQILAQCDSITLTSAQYLPDCMERRNEAMIRRADRLIAVFDGKAGGTRNTIHMAHEKGMDLRILSPIPPAVSPTASAEKPTEDNDLQIKLFL